MFRAGDAPQYRCLPGTYRTWVLFSNKWTETLTPDSPLLLSPPLLPVSQTLLWSSLAGFPSLIPELLVSKGGKEGAWSWGWSQFTLSTWLCGEGWAAENRQTGHLLCGGCVFAISATGDGLAGGAWTWDPVMTQTNRTLWCEGREREQTLVS